MPWGRFSNEMLTGRPPFQADTPLDTMMLVLHSDPVPPRQFQLKLPRDLEIICLKCLHKEPRKRYSTAETLADDLRRFLNQEPIRARPAPPWERVWKWAHRRPTAAALVGVFVLIAASIAIASLLVVNDLNAEKATALRNQLGTADIAEVPSIIKELGQLPTLGRTAIASPGRQREGPARSSTSGQFGVARHRRATSRIPGATAPRLFRP